ncbi:MAG: F0F1 ATP synthase subunit A [Anaerolineales bacterium]|nr:F0F1 ATP synthase subunit A [Anaerolineales bacterium]
MEEFFPEVAFTVFGIPIRDTVVSTWIMMVIIVALAILVGRRRPTGLEMLVAFLDDLISEIMNRPSDHFLPLLGSLAIFIAFANVIGLVPFIGSPTKDINTPIALALVVFFSVHYFGVRLMGFGAYLRHLASPIFLLPLEIISQISRTISLSIRLFGNVLSAEIIVAIIFALAPLFVPLPLEGLSIFTGVLQAYIFTALAAVYISTGLKEPEDTDENAEGQSALPINKKNKKTDLVQ